MYPRIVDFTTRQKSHLQTAKMQKKKKTRSYVPLKRGITTVQKSHFQAAKMQKAENKPTRIYCNGRAMAILPPTTRNRVR